jgi:hypothetical protein
MKITSRILECLNLPRGFVARGGRGLVRTGTVNADTPPTAGRGAGRGAWGWLTREILKSAFDVLRGGSPLSTFANIACGDLHFR